MSNIIRQRLQQIINTNADIINNQSAQSTQIRSDINAIVATLQAAGVQIEDQPTLQRINEVLQYLVSGYRYGGILHPNMQVPSIVEPENLLFFFAFDAGTYTNFDDIEVANGEIAIILWTSGTWTKQNTDFARKFQYDNAGDIPVASEDNAGTVIQYTGDTTEDYVCGFFYRSVETDNVYSWQPIVVQEIDDALDANSENPVQNAVVTAAINSIIGATSVPPTYVAPTLAISGSNPVIETGSDLSETRTVTFTQNDAGALTSAEFAGVQFTAEDLELGYKQIAVNLQRVSVSQSIAAIATYADGPIKNNNYNLPDARGRILAGTLQQMLNVYVSLKVFYGHVTDSWTLSSANVRALSSALQRNLHTIILNTGNVDKNFVIAVPNDMSIVSVIDTNAMNADITSNYVMLGTYQIEDAGGTQHTYKVYKMSMSIPYTDNHAHEITLQ